MQQTLTPHQSLYSAWLLTRRAAGDSVESLASTLVDSRVDLNPHQVEAALFACTNPLSRGLILADEVGLGKTQRCRSLATAMWSRGVAGQPPTRAQMSADRFGRHDADDQFRVAAAKLAYDLALPTESAGGNVLAMPGREEA